MKAHRHIKINISTTEAHKTTEFKVTKQPGDNFRIAAHNDKQFLSVLRNDDKLDGVEIVEPNSNTKIQEPYISNVLTVWRQLHYELDSMKRADNTCVPDDIKKNPKAPKMDPNDSPLS